MRNYTDDSGVYHVECFIAGLSWRLHSNPQGVAELLLRRFKYLSKLIDKTSHVNHCHALEILSHGLGFVSWDAFNNQLKLVADGEPAPETWRRIMSKAFLLIGCDQKDVRIPIAHLRGLEDIAKVVSLETGINQGVILNNDFSRLCSAATWSEVVCRNPMKTCEPLYSFSAHGIFESSPACTQLSYDLEDLIDSTAPYDTQKRLKWLESMYTAQPNFVEATERLAKYYIDHGLASKALGIIKQPIDYVLSLVPDEFTGIVSYWSGQNRPILRLLFRRIEAHKALGNYYEALQAAEDLLYLSPSDGMQIRFELTELLKKLGRNDLAAEWKRAIRKGVLFWLPMISDDYLSELALDKAPS